MKTPLSATDRVASLPKTIVRDRRGCVHSPGDGSRSSPCAHSPSIPSMASSASSARMGSELEDGDRGAGEGGKPGAQAVVLGAGAVVVEVPVAEHQDVRAREAAALRAGGEPGEGAQRGRVKGDRGVGGGEDSGAAVLHAL